MLKFLPEQRVLEILISKWSSRAISIRLDHSEQVGFHNCNSFPILSGPYVSKLFCRPIHIREILISDLGWSTGYPDWDSSWISQFLEANAEIIPRVDNRCLPNPFQFVPEISLLFDSLIK
jgi:hypothetical protein